MNRKILKLILLCMLILAISSCTSNISPTTEIEDSYSPQPTSTPEETVMEQPTNQPLNYTWEAHVYSDVYRQTYGEETEQIYYAVVDAIMAGEDSAACTDEEMMYNLNSIMMSCFPPYSKIISGFYFEDGRIYLDYSVDDDEREQLLNEFEEQIAGLIELSGIEEGDSQKMMAIGLYHTFSGIIMYDYQAMESEMIVDVTSYRALMDLSGICQSFASAYAYLCLQCGIDAVAVSGMTDTFESHEWTLLTLDGKYYYADSTFENTEGGNGLKYFGMTAAQRELEGGFIADEYNIGNTNAIWGRDIEVTDEGFAPLWEAVYVVDMLREDGAFCIQCERADGTEFEFVVE